MAVTISSNRLATSVLTRLDRVTAELSNVSSQLSSGLRINRAADDAAGLSIADQLNADVRIASIALRNTNDALFMTAISDSAASTVTDILTRMGELAEQAANGVLSSTQRSSLDKEFQAMGSEVERIAVTTQYNGINLLSSAATVAFQVGFQSFSTSQISMTTTQLQLQGLGLAGSGSSALIYSLNASTNAGGQEAAKKSLDAVLSAMQLATIKRGDIGAVQSRLQTAVTNLQTARESFAEAESRIRDVDVATATGDFLRLKILQQSGVAILAQAKLQPQLALQLISS
jgi:flagellin